MNYTIVIEDKNNRLDRYKNCQYLIFSNDKKEEMVHVKSTTFQKTEHSISLSNLEVSFLKGAQLKENASRKLLFDSAETLTLSSIYTSKKTMVHPIEVSIVKSNGKKDEVHTFLKNVSKPAQKEDVEKIQNDHVLVADRKLVMAIDKYNTGELELCMIYLRQALDQLTYSVLSKNYPMTQLKSESLLSRISNTLKLYGLYDSLNTYKEMINNLNESVHGNLIEITDEQVYMYIQYIEPLITLEKIRCHSLFNESEWIQEKKQYRCKYCHDIESTMKKICPQCRRYMKQNTSKKK